MRNVLLILFFFIPWNAYAYIGPGLGVSTLGVVFGTLLSLFLALLAIIWYPFKRLFKKLRTKKKPAADPSKSDQGPS